MSQTRQLNLGSFISFKSIELASGEVHPMNITGQFFICTESSDQFKMSIDDGEEFQMELGLRFRLLGDDIYSQLTFRNDTEDTLTLSFYAGAADMDDARLNSLIEHQIAVGYRALSTRVVPGDTSIDAYETLTFIGLNGGTRRKQIVVSNSELTADLKLLDSDDEEFDTVFPRQKWTMETDATIKVYNPNLVAMAINVSEFYYLS